MTTFSIYTPTHNPQYINEAYQSLLKQGNEDWEWIIVPNNGCKDSQIPMQIRTDARVRVRAFPAKDKSQHRIGALKAFACEHATGDYLVELDHDDMLTPKALSRIRAVFEQGCDFVYSDTAVFDTADNTPFVYSPDSGFEGYEVTVYGQSLRATRCFPLSPRSLCEVYYAPDHVRCWRRTFYQKIEGYRKDFYAGDDHELICKTYCNGGVFGYTQSCDYLYRAHKGNTVRNNSYLQEIQRQVARNCEYYLPRLVDEWVKRNSLPVIKYDFKENPDLVLHQALSEAEHKAGTVGFIELANIHKAQSYDRLWDFTATAYRLLLPGGYLRLTAASGTSAFTCDKPLIWTEATFDPLCEESEAHLIPSNRPEIRQRWQRIKVFDTIPNPDRPRRVLVDGWFAALKGQPQPGRVYI